MRLLIAPFAVARDFVVDVFELLLNPVATARVVLPIATKNLVGARRRSLLLGTAIAIVTTMLVILLSISAGIADNLVKNATTLSAGHVVVAGFYKSAPGEAIPLVTGAKKVREIVEKNTPGLDYTLVRGRGWGKMVGPEGSAQVGMSGLLVEEESRLLDTLQVAQEKDFKKDGTDKLAGDPHDLSRPRSVVIFASHARRLGVGVGDTVTMQTETQGGRTNTMDLTVVAVARDLGLLSSFTAFMRDDDQKELYRMAEDTMGAVWIYLKDPDAASDTMYHLREVLAKEGYQLLDYDPNPFFFKFEGVMGEDWTGQKLDATIWKDEVSFLTWVVTGFDAVTFAVAFILLVIIGVGIFNTMWNAVRERTREIGTMRAIGMPRGRILALFVTEAALLGLGATSAGAAVGATVSLAIEAAALEVPIDALRSVLLSNVFHMTVTGGNLAVSIGFITVCTVLAAIIPAARAARLKPITALGYAS